MSRLSVTCFGMFSGHSGIRSEPCLCCDPMWNVQWVVGNFKVGSLCYPRPVSPAVLIRRIAFVKLARGGNSDCLCGRVSGCFALQDFVTSLILDTSRSPRQQYTLCENIAGPIQLWCEMGLRVVIICTNSSGPCGPVSPYSASWICFGGEQNFCPL